MGYLDPTAFGLLSQFGYLALFLLVSIYLAFFKSVKGVISRLVGRLHARRGTF